MLRTYERVFSFLFYTKSMQMGGEGEISIWLNLVQISKVMTNYHIWACRESSEVNLFKNSQICGFFCDFFGGK